MRELAKLILWDVASRYRNQTKQLSGVGTSLGCWDVQGREVSVCVKRRERVEWRMKSWNREQPVKMSQEVIERVPARSHGCWDAVVAGEGLEMVVDLQRYFKLYASFCLSAWEKGLRLLLETGRLQWTRSRVDQFLCSEFGCLLETTVKIPSQNKRM